MSKKFKKIFYILGVLLLFFSFPVISKQLEHTMNTQNKAQEVVTIKLMNFNILFSAQTKERLENIAKYIHNTQVDIIALEETFGYIEDGEN